MLRIPWPEQGAALTHARRPVALQFPKCVGPDDSHRLTEIVRSDAFTQANDPPGAAADFLKIMEVRAAAPPRFTSASLQYRG